MKKYLKLPKKDLMFFLRKISSITLIYIINLVITKYAGEYCFTPAINHADNKLKDIIHSHVPPSWGNVYTPGTLLFGLPTKFSYCFIFIFVALILHEVRKNAKKGILLLEKSCLLHNMLLLMRNTLVIATILPTPLGNFYGKEVLSQQTNLGQVMFCFGNDLMFSGHIAFNVLVTCIVCFSNWHLLLKAGSILLTSVSIVVSSASRDHYTIDVLVALYITVLSFLVYRNWFKKLFSSPKA